MRLHPIAHFPAVSPPDLTGTPDVPATQPALPAPSVRLKTTPRKAAKAARTPARGVEDLDRVARRLEADWQTALRQHEAAVHRQFHDLRAAVRRRKALPPKAAVGLRKALEPKLKPKRGRAKDLKRVESALDDALARLG